MEGKEGRPLKVSEPRQRSPSLAWPVTISEDCWELMSILLLIPATIDLRTWILIPETETKLKAGKGKGNVTRLVSPALHPGVKALEHPTRRTKLGEGILQQQSEGKQRLEGPGRALTIWPEFFDSPFSSSPQPLLGTVVFLDGESEQVKSGQPAV